jgi:PilZ domain
LIERRIYPRRSLRSDVEVMSPDDGSTASWPTLDISQRGVAIYCEDTFTIGGEVYLQWPDLDEPVLLETVVAWSRGDVHGLAFVEPLTGSELATIVALDGVCETAALLPGFARYANGKTSDPVEDVYKLIARRELSAMSTVLCIARAAAPSAVGSPRLALFEAIVDATDALLTELGEHGVANFDPGDIDVAGLVEECASAWAEVTRLRAEGTSHGELVDRYVGDWMVPIGSRKWLDRMRLAIVHRDPAWILRIAGKP